MINPVYHTKDKSNKYKKKIFRKDFASAFFKLTEKEINWYSILKHIKRLN